MCRSAIGSYASHNYMLGHRRARLPPVLLRAKPFVTTPVLTLRGFDPEHTLMLTSDQMAGLRDELGRALERNGRAFLEAPLVFDTPDFFPDEAQSVTEHVGWQLVCLCHYAGVEPTRVRIEAANLVKQSKGQHTAGGGYAWSWGGATFELAGLDEELHVLFDPFAVADTTGALGEAAAFVAALRLHLQEVESVLPECEAVALGLGVLVANATERVTTGGEGFVTQTARSSAASIGLHGIAYLLALQATHRGDPDQLARALEPNPRALFRAYMTHLSEHPEDAELSFDSKTGEVMRTDLELNEDDLTIVLDEHTLSQHEENCSRQRNSGHPVFRVRHEKPSLAALAVLAAFFVIGMVVATQIDNMFIGIGLVLVGIVVAKFVPYRVSPQYSCSDPDCPGLITKDLDSCPGCGGTIRGELGSRAQRLEASEALTGSDDWYAG